MKPVRRLLTAMLLTSLVFANVEAQERRLAVVAGINAYRGNSGLPKLQHAASDAAVLSGTLRDVGFKVYEMTHEVARQDGQETMAPQLDYLRDQIRGVLETPNLGPQSSRRQGRNKTWVFSSPVDPQSQTARHARAE